MTREWLHDESIAASVDGAKGKVAAKVEEGPDWIRVPPPAQIQSATIDTYDDHRMAMAFSLVAAATETVILAPDCTSKTFPGYFEALQSLSGPQ